MSGELPAWTTGPLRIQREVLDEIEAHAAQEYPSESCGFVLGPADDVGLLDEARREENLADKYHAKMPDRFPRTSKMYFKIDELRAARSFDAAAEEGRPIKVIYHSHCDAGAYFSAEDAATFSSSRQLMWPCAFIVVSVKEGEVADRKLWVHRPGSDEFDESSLEVIES